MKAEKENSMLPNDTTQSNKFEQPLPVPTTEMYRDKDTVVPGWSMERYLKILTRYGVLHSKVTDVDKFGLAMHWKQDARNVNQGLTFYMKDTDTFYLKTSSDSNPRSADPFGYYMNDVLYLDVERRTVNPDYNRLIFSVGPPFSDINKSRISVCENHAKKHGVDTFFTIIDAENKMEPKKVIKNEEDQWIFDITGNIQPFMSFKLKMWCSSLCQKGKFSDKRDQINFWVTLTGENVKEIKIWTSINSQMNPGRGAKVVTAKSNAPTKTFQIEMPHYNWSRNDANSFQATATKSNLSGDKTKNTKSPVSFTDYGNRFKFEVDIPRNFYSILGPNHARAEIESLQRDIVYLTHHKFKDAMKKRRIVDDEKDKNMIILQNTNNTLRHALGESRRNLAWLYSENERMMKIVKDNNASNANTYDENMKPKRNENIIQVPDLMLKFENDNDIEIVESTNDGLRVNNGWERTDGNDELALPEFTIKEEEIDVETL